MRKLIATIAFTFLGVTAFQGVAASSIAHALTSTSFEANLTEVGGNVYGSMVASSTSFSQVSELCLFCEKLFSSTFGVTEGVVGGLNPAAPLVVLTRRPGSRPSIIQAYCGDAHINQAGEECDDGNRNDGDGCSRICKIEDGETVTAPEVFPAPEYQEEEVPDTTPETPEEEPEQEEDVPEDTLEIEDPMEEEGPLLVINPPERQWDIDEELIAPQFTFPTLPTEETPEYIAIEPEVRRPAARPTPTPQVTRQKAEQPGKQVARRSPFYQAAPFDYLEISEAFPAVCVEEIRREIAAFGRFYFPYLMIIVKLLASLCFVLLLIMLTPRRDD